MATRKFQLDIDHREAAAVGRDEREFVILETKQNTVEDVARFVSRNGIGSFAQTIAQILLTNGHHFRTFEFRQRREFLLWQAEDFEKALSAANRSSILTIDIDLDFAHWQFANNVEEATRRQCGRAFFLDLRLKDSPDADVEVGSGEMNFVLVSLQKHVRQNWQGGASADDVLDLLQTFEQLFFRGAKFHDGKSRLRCKACHFIRQP